MDVVRCSRSLLQRPSIDNLPDCLLSEILMLLPQKSIIQCKCVSQRWCSLISSPSFAYFVNNRFHASTILERPSTLLFSYNNHGNKNKMVLVTSEEPKFKSLASSIHQYYNTNSFVSDDIAQASCHDLLLCYKNVFVADDDVGSRSMTVYYVLNPITRQSKALPPLCRSRSARIGFIFSCKKEQQSSYRVMRIPKFEGESTEFKVDIFSSDTGKWSESVVSCPQGFQLANYAYAGVPYHGLLFWWSSNGHLVGFDPYTSKCCRVIDKPVELALKHGIQRLGVCNGALRICQIVEENNRKLLVWELKDYDTESKWSLEHKVNFNDIVSGYPRLNRIPSVLAYHLYDRDIVYVMLPPRVFSLNMRRKRVEIVCDFPRNCTFYNGFNVFNFVFPCWPTHIPSYPESLIERKGCLITLQLATLDIRQ